MPNNTNTDLDDCHELIFFEDSAFSAASGQSKTTLVQTSEDTLQFTFNSADHPAFTELPLIAVKIKRKADQGLLETHWLPLTVKQGRWLTQLKSNVSVSDRDKYAVEIWPGNRLKELYQQDPTTASNSIRATRRYQADESFRQVMLEQLGIPIGDGLS